MEKSVMSVKEVASYLGFSPTKVYRLVAAGAIPCSRVGGQYRFMKSAIDRWLTEQSPEPRPVTHRADAVAKLRKLRKDTDPLTRRLLLVGIITKELKDKDIGPIVVGGLAVEFYTAGGYTTGDIDLVYSGYQEIGKVLEGLGFTKEGRHWLNEELGVLIEVPASALAGAYDRLALVDIEGLKVYVIGIEDIILDRLCAFVHWGSLDDGRWAREMAALHRGDIDWNYLKARAKEEQVSEAAEQLAGGGGAT